MNRRITQVILIVLCVMALVACSAQAPTTATPAGTSIPTVSEAPTFTALPPVTVAPLGSRQKVDAGGYSLQVPENFEVKIRDTQATINNPDSTILISMALAPHKSADQTVESVLNGFIKNVSKDVSDFKAGDPYTTKIGKLDGKAVGVSGTFFKAKSAGQITVVDTGEPGFLIVFGFAADRSRWDAEGGAVFEAVLGSIEFFPPAQSASGGSCVISTDPNYGYTKENPIKVGGDAFDGPPRERAYLDNLAGPKGEKLSYSRSGSSDFGDTILDTFVITGLEKDVTLYVDEYSFTDPQAPVGFTCLAAFSLTKP